MISIDGKCMLDRKNRTDKNRMETANIKVLKKNKFQKGNRYGKHYIR